MKLLPLSRVSREEFVGSTFDEALRLARRELGEDALIRCWRVRRGGVFGFFAKESFIAGLTVPEGAEPSRSRGKGHQQSEGETSSHLYDLVDATTDEVSLESDPALDRDFSKVLAEAEAVLMGAVDKANSNPVEEAAVPSSEKVEGLIESLTQLGLPSEYLPEGESLDLLLRSLSTLPAPSPITKADGSLLVVVGPKRDALATARHLVAHLGLDDADLVVGDRNASVRQRVARRRSAKKMTVLVVEASLKSRQLGEVSIWIEKMKPEHVIAAISSSVSRSDFDLWSAQIAGIESLALTRLAEAPSPCQLVGALPIAFLDGAPATTLRWVAVLLDLKLAAQN